jgi:hypothetical protein
MCEMRRTALWLLALPFAGVSVLAGHWAAYRIAGAPADNLHGYLAHGPQLVAILATLALIGLARDGRARHASPMPIALLGTFAFAVQEHVERLVHTGHIPFLLTSPVFLLGIVLQLPLAVAVWLAARSVAGRLGPAPRRAPPRLGLLPLVLPPVASGTPRAVVAYAPRGRGPPHASR